MWACIACGIGYLMMGPTPLLPFLPKQTWFITLGLVFFGLGIGCTIIPTTKCVVIGARELGFPDNFSTFGMVSGLFVANFHFGAFLGPTVGGVLVEKIGFEYSSTVIAGIFATALLVIITFFGFRRWRAANRGNPHPHLADDHSKQNNRVKCSGDMATPKNSSSRSDKASEKTPLFRHNGTVSDSGQMTQGNQLSQSGSRASSRRMF
ncbi:MFS-type transporter SLC18B1-like [Elysia marginata]|uniref:MFS-type transporter SLC18B1-like n=1 Tax=Elysia marginata TaxID=1093978 RepID=A0AAV4K224_9GAST|nr:MFS-type transporter SLC18B1-like [Elysia marginata]